MRHLRANRVFATLALSVMLGVVGGCDEDTDTAPSTMTPMIEEFTRERLTDGPAPSSGKTRCNPNTGVLTFEEVYSPSDSYVRFYGKVIERRNNQTGTSTWFSEVEKVTYSGGMAQFTQVAGRRVVCTGHDACVQQAQDRALQSHDSWKRGEIRDCKARADRPKGGGQP